MNEREFKTGVMDNGERITHSDKLEAINTSGLAHLLEHFHSMQDMMRQYVVPEPYVDREGKRYALRDDANFAFANDMVYMMDGPEQRAIEEEIANGPNMVRERDYIDLALRTESTASPLSSLALSRLLHAAIGMVTESGEFIDALKKHLFYGKPLDVVNLREEIGDQLWYIAIALNAMGSNFETEMRRNIDKLKKRYPDKFNSRDAINRDLGAERRILETDQGGSVEHVGFAEAMQVIVDEPCKLAHEMAPEGVCEQPSHLAKLVSDHDKKYKPIHGSDGTDGA